jgi:hypothetical protein
MMRFFHARWLLLNLALIGSLSLASGCGDSNPVSTDSSGTPPPGARTGASEKEARLKALGNSGQAPTPKTAGANSPKKQP